MDILNPFGDEHVESPGEKYARLARETSKFIVAVGGPKLNEDALGVIIGDILDWFAKLK